MGAKAHQRTERGNLMKVSEALLDERIVDNTRIIIKTASGRPITAGRWYQDNILVCGHYDVSSVDFVAEKNMVILQLV